MRVIKNNAPGDPLNNGVVVFHAGANVARRWEDFQQYSEADKEFFDQLLPMEGIDFTSGDELQIQPGIPGDGVAPIDVRGQTDVSLQEIPLIEEDPEAQAALKTLKDKGYNSDQVREAFEKPDPVPATKARQRQAKRSGLDMRVKTTAAQVLAQRGIKPEGQELDRQRLDRTNLIVVKSAIDRLIAKSVGRKLGERSRS
jgi:hypothetical protein